MTDPRIAIERHVIVRDWFEARAPGSYLDTNAANELLSALDAHLTSPEMVERVAIVLFDANVLAAGMEPTIALGWLDIEDSAREFWRKLSRAALAALVGGGK